MGFVYMVTCSKTGKSYIGWTSGTLENRLKAHFRESRNGYIGKFANAIRKYGEDSFSIKPLFESGTKAVLLKQEITMIEVHKTFDHGYNATRGGEGGRGEGYRHSEETKLKMRLARLGKPMPEDAKQKMIRTKTGKKKGPTSEETKRKISESLTGRSLSEYQIEAMKEGMAKHQHAKKGWETRRKNIALKEDQNHA